MKTRLTAINFANYSKSKIGDKWNTYYTITDKFDDKYLELSLKNQRTGAFRKTGKMVHNCETNTTFELR